MGRTLHIGIDKRYLLKLIALRDDWREYLVDWDGTREEALAALRADPRTTFADCDCRKNADGSCSGEPQ